MSFCFAAYWQPSKICSCATTRRTMQSRAVQAGGWDVPCPNAGRQTALRHGSRSSEGEHMPHPCKSTCFQKNIRLAHDCECNANVRKTSLRTILKVGVYAGDDPDGPIGVMFLVPNKRHQSEGDSGIGSLLKIYGEPVLERLNLRFIAN